MGRRLGARAIDAGIILLAVAALAVVWVGSMAVTGSFAADTPPPLYIIGALVLYTVAPLGSIRYEVLFIAIRGATPGKAILGIKVIQPDTFQPIGLGPVVRALAASGRRLRDLHRQRARLHLTAVRQLQPTPGLA